MIRRRFFVDFFDIVRAQKSTSRLSPAVSSCRASASAPAPNAAAYLRRYAVQSRSYASQQAKSTNPQIRDEDIKAQSVCVVDSQNRLADPQPLRDVLGRLNREEEVLVKVADPPAGSYAPICKIMNKKVMYQAQKDKAKARTKKNLQNVTKQLELNWAIDLNDLEHRLGKMREFLEKGNKVEILLASKRKGRKASTQEAEEVLRRIHRAVDETEGAKMAKEPTGKLLGQYVILLDGSPKK